MNEKLIDKNRIKRSMIILLSSIVVGYLLLVAVYCIPQRFVFLGCANSINVFQSEIKDEVIKGYPNSRLDIFTDGAMFNSALFDSDESPFVKATACHQYVYDDVYSPEEAMIRYVWGDEEYGVKDYHRYWHGFLLFLKPLLMFFNYSDIRVINQFFEVLVICTMVLLLGLCNLKRYILPVIITYSFLMPTTLSMALQYSSVYYVGMISGCAILYQYFRKGVADYTPEIFLISGILTVYLDLLTYPIFSLGIPLVLVIIVMQEKEKRLKDIIIAAIICSVFWGIGYFGMWAGKWVIALIVAGPQTITRLLEQIMFRAGMDEKTSDTSFAKTLTENFFMLKKNVYYLALLLPAFACAVIAFVKKVSPKDIVLRAIPFLMVMLYPFAWYMITIGHADEHAWFTHKTLTVFVFAFLCMVFSFTHKVDNKQIG